MDSSHASAISPHTLTILTTYQCTAACKQCCFESSPQVRGRLSIDDILARISEAHLAFPDLKLVAFSGGEATLLKDDLYTAIAHASGLGLMTRIVSNGSWGKTEKTAARTAQALFDSGLNELNISTGKDHQEWVPMQSVVNAAEATAQRGIFTLITVEADDEESNCLVRLAREPRVRELTSKKQLTLQSNSWMPFKSDAGERRRSEDVGHLRTGCTQIFGNVVVTPHDNLSACCGLTLEHIPEMRLGRCDGDNMDRLYRAQAEDFLKFWIHVDGPYAIVERVMGETGRDILKDVVHVCQACALMHKDPRLLKALQDRYVEFIPEVMTRFHVKRALEAR